MTMLKRKSSAGGGLMNWPTGESTSSGKEIQLKIHLACGAGSLMGVDVGSSFRREYVLAGSPMKQMAYAEAQAKEGMLVVSPEVWALAGSHFMAKDFKSLSDGCVHVLTMPEQVLTEPVPWREQFFEQIEQDTQVLDHLNDAHLSALRLYVAGPMRQYLDTPDCNLQAAATLREGTMMFVKIHGLVLSSSDVTYVELLQRVVFMVQGAAYLFQGSLSRIEIGDKGLVIKLTFGVPPMAHRDVRDYNPCHRADSS